MASTERIAPDPERVAAFHTGVLSGWPLEKCARLANAVGGLTVQRMGGAEAIVSLEKTLDFMDTLV